ncbi:MAG: methyltransferase domain-containing protein [Phycisphaeraceae bacterium]|nr:methyltransferase domain-containing protein [Phycisphaeraceae bacterium]
MNASIPSVTAAALDRQRQWWDAKADREENDQSDEPVNRALRWREIERRLVEILQRPEATTILDVGGATGAFSIPLARRGYQVTHLDLSQRMLDIARQKAGDLSNIRFEQGDAADLSRFADRSFDLVLNMDGAISFCGPAADRAVAETCRVAKRWVVLTVSHRASMVRVWLESSLIVYKRIIPAVYEMLDHGRWEQEQFPENPGLVRGITQDYFGHFRAYHPHELRALVERVGLEVLRCGGVGTLANFLGRELTQQACQTPDVFEPFVDLCERFDLEAEPDGPGTRQRSGLLLVARRSVTAAGDGGKR